MKIARRTILFAVLAIAAASVLRADDATTNAPAEPAKVKVALVNVQRIVNNGNYYEKLRMLSLDKNTLDALKKINAEIQEIQKQLVDADDQATLNDLSQKLQFLTQKSQMLRQRAMNHEPNRDVQALVRQFIVKKFKDQYAVIIQQQDTGGNFERVLWKGNVEVEDITDDVQSQFHEYLDKLVTGEETTTTPAVTPAVRPVVRPPKAVPKPVPNAQRIR